MYMLVCVFVLLTCWHMTGLQLVNVVAGAMKAHPSVEDVQCHCVGLLVALSRHAPLLKHMARAGCASAIAGAGHCYPEDAEVGAWGDTIDSCGR